MVSSGQKRPRSSVCVCVEHLSRCKTSTLVFLEIIYRLSSRGHRPIVDTCAHEAIPRWGKQLGTLSCVPVYFLYHGMGLSQEPHPRFGLFDHLHVRLPQSEHDTTAP